LRASPMMPESPVASRRMVFGSGVVVGGGLSAVMVTEPPSLPGKFSTVAVPSGLRLMMAAKPSGFVVKMGLKLESKKLIAKVDPEMELGLGDSTAGPSISIINVTDDIGEIGVKTNWSNRSLYGVPLSKLLD